MFEITKYKIDLTETDQNHFQNIRIEFKYLGDLPKSIQVKLVNPIFTEIFHYISGSIKILPNSSWFVTTDIGKPWDIKFNTDCEVHFVDTDNKEVLQKIFIPTFQVDYKRRSLKESFSKKNVWVFGDSHVDYFFCYTITHPILQTNSYTLNPISNAALTVNRFTNRDYLKFFSSLPILSGDEIILMLGEIDCRVSLLRNSSLKSLDLKVHISNVISKYKESIDKIQNKYPQCKIKICYPLPMVPNDWVKTDKDNLLGDWDESDRIIARDIFIKELQSQIEPYYNLIDITPGLCNEKGVSNTSLLIEDDMHFLTTDIVTNNIKKHIT